MGVATAIMAAGTAISMAGSIANGISQQKQADANAEIYEAQARNIQAQKSILKDQYITKEAVLNGTAVTNAARSGLKISGSTAQSISQSITQLQLDQSYEQYNLDVQRQQAYSNAELQRRKGRMAMMNGFIEAGTTALSKGVNMYSNYWKPTNIIGTKTTNLLSGGYDYTSRNVVSGRSLFA